MKRGGARLVCSVAPDQHLLTLLLLLLLLMQQQLATLISWTAPRFTGHVQSRSSFSPSITDLRINSTPYHTHATSSCRGL